MVWFQEFKGKLVYWAVKGAKGRGKPTGRYVFIPRKRKPFWMLSGKTWRSQRLSYKPISEKKAKQLGLKRKKR